MDTKDIETFDPTVAELTSMVEATKDITATDLGDKAQLEIVRTNRIALKGARVKIEKRGKELREDALKFQKAVIAKERELIAIIAPEEDRLSAIEDEAKQIAIRKAREVELPSKKERLAAIGDGVDVGDDYLLSLSETEFETYVNNRTSAKLISEQNRIEAERVAMELEKQKAEAERSERDQQEKQRVDAERAAIETEKRAIEQQKQQLAAEKDAREREEKARVEERQRAEQEATRREEQRIEAERVAKEQEAKRVADEKARLEKAAKYRAFREKLGWTEKTKAEFREENVGGEMVLWKKLGLFRIS